MVYNKNYQRTDFEAYRQMRENHRLNHPDLDEWMQYMSTWAGGTWHPGLVFKLRVYEATKYGERDAKLRGPENND